MSSSPNISFVLHDVARLFRRGPEPHSRAANIGQLRLQTLTLITSNLLEACTQPAVDREKTHG